MSYVTSPTKQGGQGLEFKALKERKTLRSRGAGHPGTVETFEKIKLGHGATPTDIIQHLRGVRGGELSRELEAAFQDPVEVQAVKTIRKKLLGAERGTVSFEVTGTKALLFFSSRDCTFDGYQRG